MENQSHTVGFAEVCKTYDTEPMEYSQGITSVALGVWLLLAGGTQQAYILGLLLVVLGTLQVLAARLNRNNGVRDMASLYRRLGPAGLLVPVYLIATYYSAGTIASVFMFLAALKQIWIYFRIWRLFKPQWLEKLWTLPN